MDNTNESNALVCIGRQSPPLGLASATSKLSGWTALTESSLAAVAQEWQRLSIGPVLENHDTEEEIQPSDSFSAVNAVEISAAGGSGGIDHAPQLSNEDWRKGLMERFESDDDFRWNVASWASEVKFVPQLDGPALKAWRRDDEERDPVTGGLLHPPQAPDVYPLSACKRHEASRPTKEPEPELPTSHSLAFHSPGWHRENATPIVDGKYIDRETGEVRAAVRGEHEDCTGPPAVDIIIKSQHTNTVHCCYRAARRFPMEALLCHIMKVVGERKLEVDSVMATRYAIRIILIHELTPEEFTEISDKMANGIWDQVE